MGDCLPTSKPAHYVTSYLNLLPSVKQEMSISQSCIDAFWLEIKADVIPLAD